MKPTSIDNPNGCPEGAGASPAGEPLPIAAVLMAAGISARYGAANKLLASIDGRPLILRAADAAADWPFAQRIAVVRDPQAAELLKAYPEGPAQQKEAPSIVSCSSTAEMPAAAAASESSACPAAYRIVPNTGEDLSVRRTVRLALETLDRSCAGALFCVCDQPLLSAATVARICRTFLKDPTRIVTLSWQGKRGNPVLFPRSVFPEHLSLGENEAGRAVLKRRPELVTSVEAAGEEELFDIDTAQQMTELDHMRQE